VVNPAILKKKSQVTQRYEWLFRGCKIHRFTTLQDFRRDGLHLLINDREGANKTIQPTDGVG
jgi:hypothetical protein